MPHPIQSNQHHYPVGRRHEYVYWLVQGDTNLTCRNADVKRLIDRYELTDEEVELLMRDLAYLDRTCRGVYQTATELKKIICGPEP